MTTPNAILADLLPGQATADAVAEHLRVPMLAIKAMLQRHETDGLVTQQTLDQGLVTWRLTDNGRDVAHSLKPTAKVS